MPGSLDEREEDEEEEEELEKDDLFLNEDELDKIEAEEEQAEDKEEEEIDDENDEGKEVNNENDGGEEDNIENDGGEEGGDENDGEEEKQDNEDENLIEKIIQRIDGFPIPRGAFTEENFRKVLAYEFRPTDIVLTTFPKCGTTWTQYIIWEIMNGGQVPPDVNQLMLKLFPFLEMMGLDSLDGLEDPRLIKLHLPYELTPKTEGTRYVHVLRNPFDVTVSLWAHLQQMDGAILGIDLPFDQLFDAFLEGRVMFGDYFQHEIGWFEHRNDPNVLFLTFESMKRNPEEAILEVADFLGQGEIVRNETELLENILEHTSFDFLKENFHFRFPKDVEALKQMGDKYKEYVTDNTTLKDDSLFRTVNFFRQGKIGNGRETLSEDQWRRMEEAIQERVDDPELRELMLIARAPPVKAKSGFCQIL